MYSQEDLCDLPVIFKASQVHKEISGSGQMGLHSEILCIYLFN